MALEKKLESVPPILFTSNGTMFGVITVADTAGFRTKQIVAVSNGSSNPQSFQVKRVLSSTQLIVGPKDNKITINDYSDVSAYTVASGAIIFAAEQDKPGIPPDPHYFAVYESDPVVADRVVQVNKYGQIYDSVTGVDGKNRLAVDAAVTVTGVTVDLDAFTKIPPDNAISVGTEDGTLTGVKHAQKIDDKGDLHVINMGALVPKEFDDIDITNSVVAGQTVPTVIQYFQGGSGGTLVATLTLTYDINANLTRVART